VTLPPWHGPQVRGVPGPDYKVGPYCCNPGCHRIAEHAHHIFRRTDPRLGGAFNWVEIKGAAYQNLTGVCARCHDDLTGRVGGHKTAIKIMGDDYEWTWFWCVVQHTGDDLDTTITQPLAPIEPQPLTPEALALSRVPDPSELEPCPTCGHVKRARPLSGRGRARKSWTIKVPDDAEDGAEILDTLVDDMGMILGIEPTQVGRYYIVLPCVYYAHQEKPRFVASLKGVGG